MRQFILAVLCLALEPVHSLQNGDSVCAEGFVMDNLCINLGTLLDNRSVTTLRNPERHSVHCLVDVRSCINSGYVILKDPAPGEELYTKGWELDESGTQTMVQLGREVGDCDTCTGNGNLREGLRAGILGTVIDADADPPLISIDSYEAIDRSTVFCPAQVAPDTPSPTPIPTVMPTPSPTVMPTPDPTNEPSAAPVTPMPSLAPTTDVPTESPTAMSVTDAPIMATGSPSGAPVTDAPAVAQVVVITNMPVATTAAPVATTPAPIAETMSPVAATAAPIATISIPVAASSTPTASTTLMPTVTEVKELNDTMLNETMSNATEVPAIKVTLPPLNETNATVAPVTLMPLNESNATMVPVVDATLGPAMNETTTEVPAEDSPTTGSEGTVADEASDINIRSGAQLITSALWQLFL